MTVPASVARSLCLSLLLVLPPLPAAHAADDALARFFSGLTSLTAHFRQQVRDRDGAVRQTASGEMWIRRPGRFRWEYRKPYTQSIICDGDRVWVFEPDLDQATVRPVDATLGETPAFLLSGEQPLESSFSVELLATDREGAHYRLLPQRADSGYRSVQLLLRDGLLRRMELQDGFGQTTRLEFSDMRRNDTLAEDLFRFVPPAGIDVIGEQDHDTQQQ